MVISRDKYTSIPSLIAKYSDFSQVSFKFYHHVLGLRLLNRPKFASNGYWLWMGNCMLHLIQSDVTVRPDPVNAGTRVNHISFNVYNFKECEDRLREAKIEYQKVYVPVASGNGINQLFFQDPDYHWIELCDCQRFNDFVFGAYDEIRAEELADFYAEGGTEGKNILVAALLLLFMCWPKPEGHESYIFFNVFKFLAGDDMQLSTSELFNVFRKMSPTISSKATSMFFASLDASGDGNISFSEFISFLKSEIIPVPAEELAEPVFSILDRDATGHITVTEIVDAVQSLNVPKSSDERIHKVFADIDIDSSGSIDIHEFRKFFISFHKELRDLLYTSAGSVKFDENSDF